MLTLRLRDALLASTALFALPAHAQDTGPQTPSPPVSGAEIADSDVDAADESQDTQVSAPGAGGFGEEIIVQGRFIPEPVRNTAQVVNVLSTEEIARAGDGDIAGALSRVTGLSVNSGGFVYVRGLGDRYSLALLNGLPLPSPEPLRRVVPLDLFPTSIVSSALVQKSYSVNFPAEFGGGVINLTTPAIPDENFLTISGGISGNSETTGQQGYTYYGSKGDVIGYDFGARDVPDELQNALDQNVQINESNFSVPELVAITQSFNNGNTTLIQSNSDIPANFNADIEAGYNFYSGGTRIGIFGSAGFSNAWKTRDITQQTGTNFGLSTTGRRVRTENRVQVNGLLGLGAELPDGDTVRLTGVYIHDTSKIARLGGYYDLQTSSGFEDGDPFDALEQETSFFERQLINIQSVGEFEVSDFAINLRGGYANSKRKAPYERGISYGYDAGVGAYVNDLTGAYQGATIAFSDLDEDLWAGSIDVGYEVPIAMPLTVSAGYNFSDTSRYSERREFQFRDDDYVDPTLASNGVTVIDTDLGSNFFDRLRPDVLLGDASAFYNSIIITETGSPGEQVYTGDLTIHGGYLKAELEPIDQVRLDIGVRYETAKQQVGVINVFGTGALAQPAPLDNDYFLPAGTLTWNFADNWQFRLHGSKTIARPQFRELAPQLYTDVETDRQFRGNPFLVDTEFTNAEARLEYYFGEGQRASAAVFYKDLKNPIETIARPLSDGGLQGNFINAPKGELYGAEFELLKYFPLYDVADWLATKRLVLSANYTYTQSKIKIADDDTVVRFTNVAAGPVVSLANTLLQDGEPLTGQSDHLVNVQFGIEDTEKTQQVTMLLSYASERVTVRGFGSVAGFDPNSVEKPGLQVDLVVRDTWNISGQDFNVKFAARNIFGEDYVEKQKGEAVTIINNGYDRGTSFSFSVGTTF